MQIAAEIYSPTLPYQFCLPEYTFIFSVPPRKVIYLFEYQHTISGTQSQISTQFCAVVTVAIIRGRFC